MAEFIHFEEDVERMRERANIMGIEEDVADKLIKKVLRGELLDSQDPEKIKERLLVSTEADVQSDYVEFDDGSRIMLALENKENHISPYAYSTASIINMNCPSTTCTLTVRYYDLIWDIKYDAQVNIYTGSGTSGIRSVSNDRMSGVLYTFSKKRFGIIRANSSSSQPAKARLQFVATQKSNWYSVTRDLSLYVDRNSNVYARLEWD